MRYMIGLGVAVLALALGTGTSSAVQGPSGSYQQTCRNIGVRGNVLTAECQDADRHWRSAQLADYQRCRGDIQNLNGSLQCTGGSAYGRDHDRDGDRDRDHGRYERDRDRDHDQDWDWDRDHRNRIPRGSYVQTCQDIRVNGNDLQARCEKKNGGWKNSTLRNFYSCRDIENDNGKLRCR